MKKKMVCVEFNQHAWLKSLSYSQAKICYISVQCTFVCLHLLFCFVWFRLYHMIACSIQYTTLELIDLAFKFRSFIDTDVFIHAKDKIVVAVAVVVCDGKNARTHLHSFRHTHTHAKCLRVRVYLWCGINAIYVVNICAANQHGVFLVTWTLIRFNQYIQQSA